MNKQKNKKVKIIGILNITPDSFSDGGLFFNVDKAVVRAEYMFKNGADFIDIGGESTRPGAGKVSVDEEWSRIESILKILIKKFGANKISLDTRKPEVAKKFLAIGGKILNDVSGFQNLEMQKIASNFEKIIINHFPGKSTFEVHNQKIDSVKKVINDLLLRKKELVEIGVISKKIILDPGIGFGKTMELNKKLLKFPEFLPDEQILIGHSRKRFLGEKRFEIKPNLKAAKIAIESGASFLRVHDPENYINLLK